MKFGGTSVGSADRMKVACDLIATEAAKRPVVAVVSAMSKITDLLLDTTRHAEAGDRPGIDRNLREPAKPVTSKPRRISSRRQNWCACTARSPSWSPNSAAS